MVKFMVCRAGHRYIDIDLGQYDAKRLGLMVGSLRLTAHQTACLQQSVIVCWQ
jgi:hypothetical protein